MSSELREKGNMWGALKAVERAALMRRKSLGHMCIDEKMVQLLEKTADLCNMIAMSLLQVQDVSYPHNYRIVAPSHISSGQQ